MRPSILHGRRNSSPEVKGQRSVGVSIPVTSTGLLMEGVSKFWRHTAPRPSDAAYDAWEEISLAVGWAYSPESASGGSAANKISQKVNPDIRPRRQSHAGDADRHRRIKRST